MIRDQLLLKPYRDNGSLVQAWDARHLLQGVAVWGSINHPTELDAGWTIELALPWRMLAECANRSVPPREGDVWRLNLSRLDWEVEENQDRNGYEKIEGAEAVNWVWSSHGIPDMHLPERWGYVQFTTTNVGAGPVSFALPPEEPARRILRAIYDLQRQFREKHGAYTTNLDSLGLEYQVIPDFLWPPDIHVTPNQFEASLEELIDLQSDGRLNSWRIRQDSKLWKD